MPVFDIAWCCQPHRMGHRQHLYLKMDMDDGPAMMIFFSDPTSGSLNSAFISGTFPYQVLQTGPSLHHDRID